MIVLVKTKSKNERDKLMNMLSDAKSVLVAGQTLDRRRQELDKTRQDGSLIQQTNNLKKEIDKLHINSLPEFPIISFQHKSVTEDDIKQLIGSYHISKCSSKEEKQKQEKGNMYRCSNCGREETRSILEHP
ncbi:uncharacterized protein [Mytilus edulis]|uniref:uncharacterized protein n=1 Tax=Mytilus edulis TaxID=6550 RepID=UPI0039EF2C21